jgi:hypothetical protein
MGFDSCAWNLLAGLAIATSCIDQPISQADSTDSVEADETQASDSGTDSGTDTSSGTDTDSRTDTGSGDPDIPLPVHECANDYDCHQLELCVDNDCVAVDTPPPCDISIPDYPTVDVAEQVLALAFVDLDGDGADQLLLATTTNLYSFDSIDAMPASFPRGDESPQIHGMVGGAFDDMPGDDLIVLHDDTLDLYLSDGLGQLGPPISSPCPFPLARGLVAGTFDEDALSDLLVWGEISAGVLYGSGEQLHLLDGVIDSGGARDFGLPGEGFSLLREDQLLFIDTSGFELGSASLYENGLNASTGFDVAGVPLEVGTTHVNLDDDGWTLVEIFDRLSSDPVDRWGLTDGVRILRAGNFDGLDETDDLLLGIQNRMWLYLGNECLESLPFAEFVTNVALGDFDGDGDDELAVLTGGSVVHVIDVG